MGAQGCRIVCPSDALVPSLEPYLRLEARLESEVDLLRRRGAAGRHVGYHEDKD